MNNFLPDSGNLRISGACTSRSPLSVFAGQTPAKAMGTVPIASGLGTKVENFPIRSATADFQLSGECAVPFYRGDGRGIWEYTLKGIRGASWNNDAVNLRVSDRNNAGWTNATRNNNVGFRPASTPAPLPRLDNKSFQKGGRGASSTVADDLFKRITEFNNILSAFFKAQRAKKENQDVADFNFNLERNILKIKHVLENNSYTPEEYTKFTLYEPKKREIAAPAFFDRGVHHALCNVIAPIFEKQFIYHSYACRSHKGMHKAMVKAQDFLRYKNFYLKCDVKSFFFSIDHKILLKIISRTIKDEKTMWLIEKIVASAPNPGLPIGNLTSQLFANVHLNELDHFILGSRRHATAHFQLQPAFNNTQPKGCGYQGAYIRYMDDFVLFSNSKKQLWNWKNLLEEFLNEKLKLQLNPQKVFVAPYKEGLDFCGYRVFRDRRRLRPQNVKSFRKRLGKIRKAVSGRKMKSAKAYEKIQSWYAHSLWANTFNLRRKILRGFRWLK